MCTAGNKEKGLTTATIWSEGLNTYNSLPDREPPDDEAPPSTKWVCALERIQAHRESPLTAPEIDETLKFRLDYLPNEVNVRILSAEFSNLSLWDERDENFDRILDDNGPSLRDNLLAEPYFLWPIQTGITGDHWVVLFIVLEKSDKNSIQHDTLLAYTVVDPRFPGRGRPEGDILQSRLERIFQVCGIRSKRNYSEYERLTWVPEQKEDTWSSGLRAIWFIWEMMTRLEDQEMSGIRDVDMLFRPMRPYFNPDYVRLQAAGAIAAVGLASKHFHARIVLAAVSQITPRASSSGSLTFNPYTGSLTFSPEQLKPDVNPPLEEIPQAFLGDARIISRPPLSSLSGSARRGDPFLQQVPDLLFNAAERISQNLIEYAKQKQKEDLDYESEYSL